MKVLAVVVAAAAMVLLSASAMPDHHSHEDHNHSDSAKPDDHHHKNETNIPCFFLEMGKCICDGPTFCEMIDELHPIYKNCNGPDIGIPQPENEVIPDCTQPPEAMMDAVLCVALNNTMFSECYDMVSGR